MHRCQTRTQKQTSFKCIEFSCDIGKICFKYHYQTVIYFLRTGTEPARAKNPSRIPPSILDTKEYYLRDIAVELPWHHVDLGTRLLIRLYYIVIQHPCSELGFLITRILSVCNGSTLLFILYLYPECWHGTRYAIFRN